MLARPPGGIRNKPQERHAPVQVRHKLRKPFKATTETSERCCEGEKTKIPYHKPSGSQNTSIFHWESSRSSGRKGLLPKSASELDLRAILPMETRMMTK